MPCPPSRACPRVKITVCALSERGQAKVRLNSDSPRAGPSRRRGLTVPNVPTRCITIFPYYPDLTCPGLDLRPRSGGDPDRARAHDYRDCYWSGRAYEPAARQHSGIQLFGVRSLCAGDAVPWRDRTAHWGRASVGAAGFEMSPLRACGRRPSDHGGSFRGRPVASFRKELKKDMPAAKSATIAKAPNVKLVSWSSDRIPRGRRPE